MDVPAARTSRRPGTATSRTRASTSTLAALCAARTALPDRRVVVASEHAHSSIDRACRILGLEIRHAPVDDAFRMRVDGLDLSDACAVVATVGTTSTTSVDPVPEIADAAAASGCLAARRRRLRRLGARLPRAAHAGLRARRLGRRQSAQVAVHADRLLLPLHVAPRRPARGVRAHARVPAHLRRGRHEPQRVRAGARSPLPRAQAVGRAALLRPRRAAGDDPRARAPRRAVRGLGARRARLGDVRAAARTRSCASGPRATMRAARRCSRPSTRAARPTSRTRASNDRHVLRLAIGNAATTEDDVRLAWERPAARGGAPRRRCAGGRLMRVLVLQHIACEPPGVFEDVLRERGARARARRARRGRAAAGRAVGRDRRDGRPDERQRRGRAPLAGRARRPLIAEPRARRAAVLGLVPGRAAAGRRARRARLRRACARGRRARRRADRGRAAPIPCSGALPPSIDTLQWHGDTFDLPEGGVLLASSPGLSAPGLSASAPSPTPCSSTSRSPRRWARSGPRVPGLRRVRRPRARPGRQRPPAGGVPRQLAAHAAARTRRLRALVRPRRGA